MKKIFVFIIIIALIALVSIFYISINIKNNNRNYCPTQFNNTVWKSDDPDIFFKVYENAEHFRNSGKFRINDKEINIIMVFDNGYNVHIFDADKYGTASNSDYEILSGTCKFRENELKVKLNKNDYFAEKRKVITFKRYDANEIEEK